VFADVVKTSATTALHLPLLSCGFSLKSARIG
jgi:hypothetical protein